MRQIVNEARNSDSVVFTFQDGSTVWVRFKPITLANEQAFTTARGIAERFINARPPGRWEGKIDGEGNILESPINLE